jgi:hypothetical protein
MTSYLDFLKTKVARAQSAGFEPPSDPHPSLFGHQRDLAVWLCRGGRRACFANFGLGKTRINIQVGKWVIEITGRKYLIVAPLGVRQEFTLSDGPAMDVEIEYVRNDDEVAASKCQILITNYERVRDGDITPSKFGGVGLDEGSLLRSYGSKTTQEFLHIFRDLQFKFVFTATPSPNSFKELLHYAAFLGVMDTGEALTRFFQRDSEKAGHLTLMPHMADRFWQWVNSWAVFLQFPSDLGYSDDGYILPPMRVHWHRIAVDHREAWEQADSWGQYQLIKDQAQGLKESAKTKRNTIALRIAKAREIIESHSKRHWLIWHDLEDERREIERQIPGVVTIYGSQELETREERIMKFSRGEIERFGTKPSISGSGCNFQRFCADAIYPGVGYKFNDFIQSIHRIVRFQQTKEVNIHILHLESEDAIVESLKAKWTRHNELMARMSEMVRQHKLSNTEMAA